MTSRVCAVMMAAAVLAAAARPADAQIGGFLKKKAKEAAQAPVQQEQARQQADESAARALESPDVVPITQESTARFRRALGVEIKLLGEFRSMLASMKSKDEYEACKSEFAMSQDPMQLASALANLGDKATPAEMQKVMMKASADMEAQLTKRCGGDPSGWPDYKRAERLRAIEAEASDAMAPAGEPDAAEAPTPGPSLGLPGAGQSEAHPFARKYAISKERWIPFCGALSSAALKSEGKYTRVKGVGSGIYVYTASEADVMTANCTAVMADINQTLSSVGGAKRP